MFLISKIDLKKKKTKKTESKDVQTESLEDENISNYIKKHNLVDVTPLKTNDENEIPPRFSIYADISKEDAKEQYDKNLPPPAPVIVSGTMNNGTVYTKVIDGYTMSASKNIIVTENDSNGDPTNSNTIKDQDFSAPPSPGQ